MGRRPILVLTTALIAAMAVATTAQIKNVLLEQHTGAWCGWCPDGSAMVDEIVDLYGDQVIATKLHYGDAMAIAEQWCDRRGPWADRFPTASINRRNFGGEVS
jgi:hypothetical protein